MKKLKMNKKIILGLTVTACVASLTLQSVIPFASAVSQWQVYANEAVNTNGREVTETEKKWDKEHAPQDKSSTGKTANSFKELQPDTVEGWNFEGWYDAPLEYHFWGSEEKTFGTTAQITIPADDWKCALEFQEWNGQKDSLQFWTEAGFKDMKECSLEYKELYYRWLTRVNVSKCNEEQKAIKTVKKITEQDFEANKTYYPRYTPQTVRIDWHVKFDGEAKEWVKNPDGKGGNWVYYGNGMLTSYRQYGAQVGSLFTDVGVRAKGRKLTGWRVSTQEKSLCKNEGIWTKQENGDQDINYWWCNSGLEKCLPLKKSSEKVHTWDPNQDWVVKIVAVFDGETIVPDEETGECFSVQEQSTDVPGSDLEIIDETHKCTPDYIKIENATCTESGIMFHYECKCGKMYQNPDCTIELTEDDVYIAPHHSLMKVKGKEATCTKDGLCDYYICTLCHEKFLDAQGTTEYVGDVTVAPKGHSWSNYCYTRNGHYKVCTVCGEKTEETVHTYKIEKATTEQAKICTICGYVAEEKHVHSGTRVRGYGATCTQEGRKDYYRCSCGMIFEDISCKNEISEYDLVIPAMGHNAQAVSGTQATCTRTGIRSHYKCSSCGELFLDQECKNSACDQDLVVEKKAHTIEYEKGKEATCTDPGKLDSYRCTSCNQIFRDAECKTLVQERDLVIEAKGHVWNVDAADYEHDKHCTVCNFVEQEKLEKPAEPEKKVQPEVKETKPVEPKKELSPAEPEKKVEPEVEETEPVEPKKELSPAEPEKKVQPEVKETEPVEPKKELSPAEPSISEEPEVAEPEIKEPEIIEPEVAEPEITEPEVAEPEITKPEVMEPEITESEVAEPEVEKSEIMEREVAEPEVEEPEIIEPEVAEPEITEPEVEEPEITEPEVAEPEVAEPEITEREVAEPEIKEPDVTEPEVIDSDVTEQKAESETEKKVGQNLNTENEIVQGNESALIGVIAASASAVLVLGGAVVYVLKKRKNR